MNDWTDCLNKLGCYWVDYNFQTKAHEREKERESDANEKDRTTKTDEDADSEIEIEEEGRFGYTRTVPDSCVSKKKNIPEHMKKHADGVATRKEHSATIAN